LPQWLDSVDPSFDHHPVSRTTSSHPHLTKKSFSVLLLVFTPQKKAPSNIVDSCGNWGVRTGFGRKRSAEGENGNLSDSCFRKGEVESWIRRRARQAGLCFSLGRMTLPHELPGWCFWSSFYRAFTYEQSSYHLVINCGVRGLVATRHGVQSGNRERYVLRQVSLRS